MLQTPLIDPYGVVRDSATNLPLGGATMKLYWSDTALNRAAGRVPDVLVPLPVLPDFAPNENRVPQQTTALGQYAWMVFPQGDYYVVAEKAGYDLYDSRVEKRSVGMPTDDSYVLNGVIHVGETIVEYDLKMDPMPPAPVLPAPPPVLPELPPAPAPPAPVLSVDPPAGARPGSASQLTAVSGIRVVDLSWSSVLGADSYVVLRSTNTGGPYGVIAAGVTAAKYTDSNVMDGTTHYYVVVAVNVNGQGRYSPEASAAVKANVVPKPHGTHMRYILGYPDLTFRPENSITRAEVATILVRVLDAEGLVTGPVGYPDVPSSHWAAHNISMATQLGLMKGDPDGMFRPNDQMTRAEIATVAVRFAKLETREGNAFTDTAGHWARGTVNMAYEAGIVKGYEGGLYLPQRPASRAEFVTIMNRLLGRGPLLGRPDRRWPDVLASHWAVGHVEEASIFHEYERESDTTETWLSDK